MKKFIKTFIFICALVAAVIPFNTFAAGASASLTGNKTVRAGDTVTLSFNISGNGIKGASGTLSYDSSVVKLTGTKQSIGGTWAVEFNGNNFVAYDNNLTSPINGSKTLFTATFKVNSVAAGTSIKISYNSVTASDGNADSSIGTVTYSAVTAAPLATDNTLKTLTVSNAKISPAFSSGTLNYTAEVPFEVSKLNISAQANDSKAKVAVNSPNLTPNGTTKATVTVTAENGSKKTYTISVKRAQDPNYVPSGDNNLSGITVEGFLLSPKFTADNQNYIVWLPYETESVKISGTAADSKASLKTEGGDALLAGQDNTAKVICIAENGEQKEYTVILKRAAAHDGSVDKPQEEIKEPDAEIKTETPEKTSSGVSWWWIIVSGAAGILIGVGIMYLIILSASRKIKRTRH